MGVGGQRHASADLLTPGTHCTGGWVGPMAGLDGCGKSRPPPDFDPRTVQPVAISDIPLQISIKKEIIAGKSCEQTWKI